MKLRLTLILTTLCLMVGMMTACGNNDKDTVSKVTSTPPAATVSEPTITEDIVSEADKIGDKVESAVDKVMPKDSSLASTPSNESTSDASSNDASLAVSVLPSVDLSVMDSLDSTFHGWGQGKEVNEQKVPVGCLDFQTRYGKYNADFVKDTAKTIYLTFDEGYENGYSGEMLDVLKEKDCPAVFFITMDYAKSSPDLVQRMVDEGHVLGNHSTTHPSMPKVPTTQQVTELSTLHEYVSTNFGQEMTLFRPPMGEFSEQSLAVTKALGYRSVFWSFAYVDWDPDKQPDPVDALTKTTNAVHDGAIYLLHAVSKTNAAILGDFIDQTRAKGYTFATL